MQLDQCICKLILPSWPHLLPSVSWSHSIACHHRTTVNRFSSSFPEKMNHSTNQWNVVYVWSSYLFTSHCIIFPFPQSRNLNFSFVINLDQVFNNPLDHMHNYHWTHVTTRLLWNLKLKYQSKRNWKRYSFPPQASTKKGADPCQKILSFRAWLTRGSSWQPIFSKLFFFGRTYFDRLEFPTQFLKGIVPFLRNLS